MSKKPTAEAFLAAMKGGQQEPEDPSAKTRPAIVQAEPPVAAEPHVHEFTRPAQDTRSRPDRAKPSRAQLKHFGGYLDEDTLEKIALLRVRLKKDNSELIKFAIDELHRKHNAKRAFGDA
jgi:hypothetical protein